VGHCGRPSARAAASRTLRGIKFCGECAKSLAAIVSARESTNEHRAERVAISHAEAVPASHNIVEGERTTITVLFADIKGSMELIEDFDPEDARAIIDPVLRLMIEAVHRYEGRVAQSTGDGIFALFGAPIAYEDHPQLALHAALRMQEDVRRYAERLRLEKGLTLAIRIGVNTGEVVVRSIHKDERHTDYVPIGHSVNLAAPMEGLATPGSIAVAESTYRERPRAKGKPVVARLPSGSAEVVEVDDVIALEHRRPHHPTTRAILRARSRRERAQAHRPSGARDARPASTAPP
jgi:class 3 adenylate cyclase